MRMWMVDPKLLCRKHLLGEHSEIHKHRHNFVKCHNMDGRRGQIFPEHMQSRHDALAQEMLRRGYKHESPYEQPELHDKYLSWQEPDLINNTNDLCRRCMDCCKLMEDKQ